MQVIINKVISQIRALDGESVLSPSTLNSILTAVMQAVEERDRHAQRVGEEHRLENYQRHQTRTRS